MKTVPESEDQVLNELKQQPQDPTAAVTSPSVDQVRGAVDDPRDTTGVDEDGAPGRNPEGVVRLIIESVSCRPAASGSAQRPSDGWALPTEARRRSHRAFMMSSTP